MKFFERQKVDEIGIVGVRLQKILLFFMILNLFMFFSTNFLSIVAGLFNFTILYCGFVGAYKRRERLIQVYFTVTVLMIALSFVMVLLSVSFAASHNHEEGEGSEPHPVTMPMEIVPQNGTENAPIQTPVAQPKTGNPGSPSELPGGSNAPLSSGSSASDVKPVPQTPQVDPQPAVATGVNPLVLVLSFILSLILFFLKITSLVLASRMIRMLKERQAHNLQHPIAMTTRKTAPQPMYQPVMYIPVPVQPNTNGMAQFQSMMYNPYVTPFQPQPQSSAPKQDV